MSIRIAEPDLHARVKRLMAEHHPELHHWGVTVSVLVSDKPLHQHGAAVAATVRITPPRERAQGCADATITLRGVDWDQRSPETQDAILDHELTHLVVQTRPAAFNPSTGKTEDGALNGFMAKLDDDDRPKLKMKPHDHQFGWFESIAERWGAASLEVQQARKLAVGPTGQVFWLAALPGAPTLAATGTDDATVTLSVVGGPSLTLPQTEMERRLKSLAARERMPKATHTHSGTGPKGRKPRALTAAEARGEALLEMERRHAAMTPAERQADESAMMAEAVGKAAAVVGRSPKRRKA